MTEVNQAVAQPEVQPEAQPQEQQPAEKLLPQSMVNKVVGEAKHEAHSKGFEAGRKAALAELQLSQANAQQQAPMQQAPATQEAAPNGGVPMGNMHQGLSPEDVKRMMHEEFSRHLADQQQKSAWDNTRNTFIAKVSPEAQKDPNFYKDVIEPLDLDNNPHLITLTAHTDNPADVLRELKNNPKKISDFTNLARTHPHLALSEMQTLSNSIKQNQQALQQQNPNEPLSQLKPSTVTADNGSQTVSDLRKKSYLRR